MTNTDLLFAGTSLKSIPGLIITDWSGMFQGLYRKGDPDDVANRNGALGNQLPLAQFNFQIGVFIEGATLGQMFTRLSSLATALAGTGGLGQLERRIDNDLGGFTASFARGAFAGINPSMFNPVSQRIDLTFGNLDGCWFANSGYTSPLPI